MIFATITNIEDINDGAEKKMRNQINALELVGDTSSMYVLNNHIKLQNKQKFKIKKIKKNKILKRIYFMDFLEKETRKQGTIIYFRYFGSDFIFLHFLKKIKKNKENRIVIEIPTYPYDQENKNKNIQTYIDKIYRKKLYKYVDYIVTFSEDQHIWNIPCINISNGINLEQLTLAYNQTEREVVVFTSVSACEPWHGIDRFLNSMEIYLEQNPTSKVKFNIVGEGNETTKLKKIVSDSNHLADSVVFHGFKSGEELDTIYNETDIAIGSLGRHRSGLTSLKTLKNREYAAKGLSMIYSEIDYDLEEQPFVYKATPDEELIDLEKLIFWYQNLKMQPEDIREYAKQFSWDIQMKKVIDTIEEK